MPEILDLKHRVKNNSRAEKSSQDFDFGEKGGKKKNNLIVLIIVIVLAAALTTAGIKASDSLFGAKGQVKSLCPAEMVFVPGSTGGFCIDKYEDSASSKCQISNPSSDQDSQKNINDQNCQAVSAAGEIPWRNLTQIQAVNLCAKAGKRLPTSEEWFSASLGTPDKDSNWGLDDCQVNNNWSQQPGLTGSGKNCVSYAGAFDMIGNAWEWVQGTIEDGKYQGSSLPDEGYIKGVNAQGTPTATDINQADPNYNDDYLWIKKTGSRGNARGGYWANGNEGGLYSFYAVTEPNFSAVGVGFRCVK
jgi:formylglycine-generating enzyme required for sulfatase activity